MFDVEWQANVTDDLAAICVDHRDRWADIDAAESDISYKLRRNPLHFSQPVSEGLRRIISLPLAAYFSITGNQVSVEGVGWID